MFSWFEGLDIDDPVWDHSTYSKNLDRLLEADIAHKLLKTILEHKEVAPLLSDEHFTVDGIVNAWGFLGELRAEGGCCRGGRAAA
jgi:hypothetical protein